MKITLESPNLTDYLERTSIIDFDNDEIQNLAKEIYKKSSGQLDYIKNTYEYVRDKIAHSADIMENHITCIASEVLKEKHGIYFAKSHLLAALLRYFKIPTGFCYQRLILDDIRYPYLVVHGLNGVYIEELDKWIRLDAKGNKEGVNAQFSIDKEILAFPVRKELGEENIPIIFVNPINSVITALTSYKSREELWKQLPSEI